MLSFAIWGLLLYVWVKDVFAQLQFWILTVWLVSVTRLAWVSGREVVEKKMVERLRDEKLKDKSVLPENVAEVELPEEDKSQGWRIAMLGYSLATPLVVASPVMFGIFSESMYSGEICKFYELAGNGQDGQDQCLGTVDHAGTGESYATNPEKFIEGSGFRYYAFMIGLYMPVACVFVELFCN